MGGGEPTLHPEFVGILQDFRQQGIVPNFTTRSLRWLLNPEMRRNILPLVGAFAYSVNTRKDMQRLNMVVKNADRNRDKIRLYAAYNYEEPSVRGKVSAQYVVGVGGDLYGVLDEARKTGTRVTILGFKRMGFGADFKEIPEDWVSVVKKLYKERSYPNIGVDTAIIAADEGKIKSELGVSEVLMTKEEGKFSMYIDAVTGRFGPSSYCSPERMASVGVRNYLKLYEWKEDKLKEAFSQW